MGRTRVRHRSLAVLLTGAMIVGVWAGPMAHALGRRETALVTVSQDRYVVRSGDTLWSIAGRLAPGEDPRATVDLIARANDLDAGRLVPGQTLVIPGVG